MAYLWGWFLELSMARSIGMDGPNPISFPDIDAWSRLRGVRLNQWELSAIRHLDQMLLGQKRDGSEMSTVSVTDTAGVRSLFKSLGAKVGTRH